MKYLALLMMAILAGSAGCNSNKDDHPKARILGKWFLVKEVELEYKNGSPSDEFIDTDFTDENYIEFKGDGKVMFSQQGGSQWATYTINDRGTRLDINHSEDDIEEINIKSLTLSDLVFNQEDTEVVGEKTYKYVYESYFKKK